jgi:hypothetical protein
MSKFWKVFGTLFLISLTYTAIVGLIYISSGYEGGCIGKEHNCPYIQYIEEASLIFGLFFVVPKLWIVVVGCILGALIMLPLLNYGKIIIRLLYFLLSLLG